MKKQFVTKIIAEQLKELGYDKIGICGYNSYGVLKNNIAITNSDLDDYISVNKYDSKTNAPLWQEAIDWCREKHNISIDVSKIMDGTENYHYAVNLEWRYFSGTYYEAREQAIIEAIDLIKRGDI